MTGRQRGPDARFGGVVARAVCGAVAPLWRRLPAACRLLNHPGSVAVDAGANIGLWTVPLARVAARLQGRVVAVEPVPSNRARLAANLRLNDVAHVTELHPVALSDRAHRLVMTLREDFAAGAATGNAAILIEDGTDGRFDRVRVSTQTLDEVLVEADVARVDVVNAETRWVQAAGFISPRDVDDLVLAPAERSRSVRGLDECAASAGMPRR